ncbi:MAG: FRG domain-containing protein [Lachnospiraceae bacterium]|nr:FRG domain-containing protein [Lachnospiraceae bacterium]
MIKEIRITTLEELMPLLAEQEYRPDLHRNRSSYIYRGMSDASFKMVTSLTRNCKELQRTLEPAILENFAKYAILNDASVAKSVWHQMILGQHNGLPTRLLDWTHSPLVGLHFATSEDNMELMESHDCMVWRIDMAELVSLLPERYRDYVNQKQTTIFSVDMLKEITGNSLTRYDEDMKDQAMVIIEPPSMNPRIINQYSFFSVVPMDIVDIEKFLEKRTQHTVKYVIDASLRWRVRDMLDQLNISERIVYPGLDGLSKWIARHYYVK